MLGYHGQGCLAWLHLELVEDGTGEFYPHPDMALVPISRTFLDSLQQAWDLAQAEVRANGGGLWFRTNQATADLDVRWWIEAPQLFALDGPSLSLTLAVVLARLFSGQPVEEDVALTGEVCPEGEVQPVSYVQDKVQVALLAESDGCRPMSK
jgi:hypothetical protein